MAVVVVVLLVEYEKEDEGDMSLLLPRQRVGG